MKFLDKIKANWKIMLLILLWFLWMKGCVTQCNSNTVIRQNNETIKSLDSTVHALNDTIDTRDIEINQKNIIIEEQNKTIERLDRAASKSITVRPPQAQVIIKEIRKEEEK